MTYDGVRLYPNFGASTDGTYAQQADSVNNVEKVTITAPTSGALIQVVVVADGLASADSQKFALVVTGPLTSGQAPTAVPTVAASGQASTDAPTAQASTDAPTAQPTTRAPTPQPTPRVPTPRPTILPTYGCAATCYGETCDHWSNGCAELENAYGCSCAGCACDDASSYGNCTDADKGATDPYGDSCADYVTQWCGGYDDSDFSSEEMCCVCDGASDDGGDASQDDGDCAATCFGYSCDGWDNSCAELEAAYGCSCVGCTCDDDGVIEDDDCTSTDGGSVDLYDDACGGYAYYPEWCGNYDDSDFSSNTMCCGCGGGSTTRSPSIMPTTATPTSSAAPTHSGCLATCYGSPCDTWVEFGTYYSCDILESGYGCDCGGCTCNATDYDVINVGNCTNQDNGVTDSYEDGCDEYAANPNWCNGYDDSDFTSYEMCCACGGGSTGGVADDACVELDSGATDPYGDGCSTYNYNPHWCGFYDDSDFTSSEMCCGCGGGSTGGVGDDASCTELDEGAADPFGSGCAEYAEYPIWCGQYDDLDFSSTAMCCTCGGGTSKACESTCDGYSCDYWVELSGSDYTCSLLESENGCDCGGCACPDGLAVTHDIGVSAGLAGIACDAYTAAEEAAVNVGIASVLGLTGDVQAMFGAHTCTDDDRRRRRGARRRDLLSTSVSIATVVTITSTDDLQTAAAEMSAALASSASDNSLTSAIVSAASDLDLASMASISVTSVAATVATAAPTPSSVAAPSSASPTGHPTITVDLLGGASQSSSACLMPGLFFVVASFFLVRGFSEF